MDRKKVVVVGGGISGAVVAHLLESDFDVTLIDSKEYHEIRFATLRAMVEPKVADRIIIPHLEYFKSKKVVIGIAKSCTDTEVETNDGEVFPFDYLVIATETKPDPAIPFQDRVWYFHKCYKQIAAASSILVVGGGPIGVEFAAEVVTEFPKKKVTIVHSGDRLIECMKPKASDSALKWLSKQGVEVITNDRVKVDTLSQFTGHAGKFFTARGREIETDFLFLAFGSRPFTSWLLTSPFGDQIDENGRVKVDEFFNLPGHPNVFAIGDVTNLKEAKQGSFSLEHAKKLALNLKLKEKEGENSPLIKPYVPNPDIAIVSLGRYNGVAQLPSPMGTVSGFLPAMYKSRGLFVEKTRKDLGLTF